MIDEELLDGLQRSSLVNAPSNGNDEFSSGVTLFRIASVTLRWWRPRGNEVEENETLCKMIAEGGACMEMAYRERWKAAIAEMRRVLGGFAMEEECKWGKPTYTVSGKNVVIMQGFKEYFALGFFQGALLKDLKKVLVQLGQVHAGRVMKFTSAKDIKAKAVTPW